LSEEPFGSERECDAIADLAGLLLQTITDHGVGSSTAMESGEGRCMLFMYGPDADRLFAVSADIEGCPVARAALRSAIRRHEGP